MTLWSGRCQDAKSRSVPWAVASASDLGEQVGRRRGAVRGAPRRRARRPRGDASSMVGRAGERTRGRRTDRAPSSRTAAVAGRRRACARRDPRRVARVEPAPRRDRAERDRGDAGRRHAASTSSSGASGQTALGRAERAAGRAPGPAAARGDGVRASASRRARRRRRSPRRAARGRSDASTEPRVARRPRRNARNVVNVGDARGRGTHASSPPSARDRPAGSRPIREHEQRASVASEQEVTLGHRQLGDRRSLDRRRRRCAP